MSETLDRLSREAEAAKMVALADLLAQCSEAQRGLFDKIFMREGRTEVRGTDLHDAISLCERTIRKNRVDPTRVGQR